MRKRSTPISAIDGEGYSAGIARLPSSRARRAGDRLFGRPERTSGLDAARGAAIGALVVAAWARSSGLPLAPKSAIFDVQTVPAASTTIIAAFVVISGAALSLASGAANPFLGLERVSFRLRAGVRAILLLAFGGVVAFSSVPFAGLVATIGILSLIGLSLIGWRARRLFAVAAVWTVVVPIPAVALDSALRASGSALSTPADWFLVGAMAPVCWIGLFLAGMAVGRLELGRAGPRWLLFASATGCLCLAVGVAMLSSRLTMAPDVQEALRIHATSPTPLSLVGSGALALTALALFLLAGRIFRWVLIGISAPGTLALSLLLGCFAVAAAVWLLLPDFARRGPAAVVDRLLERAPRIIPGLPESLWPTVVIWGVGILVALACITWRTLFGDGPAERVMRAIGRSASHLPEPDRAPDGSVTDPSTSTEFDRVLTGTNKGEEAGNAVQPMPERPAVGRTPLAPTDPLATATQWTPGQALGRLPY
jgi:hypothetical protein